MAIASPDAVLRLPELSRPAHTSTALGDLGDLYGSEENGNAYGDSYAPYPDRNQSEKQPTPECQTAVYSPQTFLETALYLESLLPDDCHPALYTRRFEVAARLRKVAEEAAGPILATNHCRLLNGVRFFCYRLRG